MKKILTAFILIIISSTIGVNNIQSQNKKESDCGCYLDSTLNKWIYVSYDVPPMLPDGKDLMDIIHRIKIPDNFRDENNEFVYIIPFSLVIIIDSDGKVLSYEVSEKKKNKYTAYEKIVIRAFETEMQWIPAQCEGVDVASKHYLPLNIHYKQKSKRK